MARKEFHRICTRCGTDWYAPIATPPNRMEIAGHRMSATGARMSLFGGRKASAEELRATSLQGRRDAILASRRCPKCGSQSYNEERVKIR